MADKPTDAQMTALIETLRLNTEASNRSADASNKLSEKVDRLSTELHELRGRVETIEDAKHIEEEVAKRIGLLEPDSKSFLDVFKTPAVVIAAIAGIVFLLAFAIARDPSTAQRVVDKVPTRAEAK